MLDQVVEVRCEELGHRTSIAGGLTDLMGPNQGGGCKVVAVNPKASQEYAGQAKDLINRSRQGFLSSRGSFLLLITTQRP